MLLKWWRQASQGDTIERIYGVIVAQARNPTFYADFGVPDTVEGRFDMLLLHLFLFLRRLGIATDDRRVLSEMLFNRFCGDLDANLREMGIGDLTVPRRMQEFAGAFYGRSAAYERALATGDTQAATLAIARNIFGQDFARSGALRLAQYMFTAAATLQSVSDDALAHGKFSFPAVSGATQQSDNA